MGYYGYFVLLADKFLGDDEKMALVLPTSILNRRSCEGIRRLWAEKYSIEYIITTSQRLAFSESTFFREILLVARKSDDIKAKTTIAMLKKFPKTPLEAREVAEIVKKAESNYEDEDIAIRIHDYSKFKSNVENWYKYIAVSDLSLIDLIEEILDSDKLTKLSFIDACEFDLRYVKFKKIHGFILLNESKALRGTDVWIVDEIVKNKVIAKHRHQVQRVEIPLKTLKRGLRRFSHVNTMDVSNSADYLIVSWFDEIKNIAKVVLTDEEMKGFDKSVVKSWENKYEARKANLLLARRPYLSSPGTSLIAFYSDEPIVGIDLWCIRGMSKDYAKVLALWFNSSFNILQLLCIGVASEGPWMKIHDYMLNYLLAPKQDLSKNDISYLIKVFDSVREAKLPNILEQLKNGHPIRKEIDKAFLKVLGKDVNLDELYEKLANELELLKKL
ncbi:MAG: hypothetical protein DRN95_07190 [Candidatus Hydrothermarchaeota archaeon]|nr:MAG: hypothetical protein DRN95_07190 [Candidatus Hydrothermarchaeota archaeon]